MDCKRAQNDQFESSSESMLDLPNPKEYFSKIGSMNLNQRNSDLVSGKTQGQYFDGKFPMRSTSFLGSKFANNSFLQIPKPVRTKYSSFNRMEAKTMTKVNSKHNGILLNPNPKGQNPNYQKLNINLVENKRNDSIPRPISQNYQKCKFVKNKSFQKQSRNTKMPKKLENCRSGVMKSPRGNVNFTSLKKLHLNNQYKPTQIANFPKYKNWRQIENNRNSKKTVYNPKLKLKSNLGSRKKIEK